jgi:protein-S-isoprenylcysteine O-methyltransferase Ste14
VVECLADARHRRACSDRRRHAHGWLAAFGSALTGSAFAIGVFVEASILFLSRIPREEKIMLELFPNAYPQYQADTKRLIPFVW